MKTYAFVRWFFTPMCQVTRPSLRRSNDREGDRSVRTDSCFIGSAKFPSFRGGQPRQKWLSSKRMMIAALRLGESL